jgi:hypothetical protein
MKKSDETKKPDGPKRPNTPRGNPDKGTKFKPAGK